MGKPILKPHFRRKILLIAAVSLLLASALELYTFGLSSDFLGRWLRSFFVFFVLISLTALAIVPGVSKSVDSVMGR